MQKQSLSLSIVLTADKLVTDHLFKDGQKISLDDAKEDTYRQERTFG